MKRQTIDAIVISLGGLVVFALFWIAGFDHTKTHRHVQASTPTTITRMASSGVGAEVVACTPGKGTQIRVEISDTAYNPSAIVAKRCDIVTIVNVGKMAHQPASGPHPTHDSYPELNAPEELKSGDSFTAQLVKSGEYTMHDHINEEIEATLSVAD